MKPPPALLPDTPQVVPLREVETALRAHWGTAREGRPLVRAALSNLLIFSDEESLAADIAGQVPVIVASHPARVLILVALKREAGLTAQLRVRGPGPQAGATEEITLRAGGEAIKYLPYAARALQVGGLPTNLWWASQEPPDLATTYLADLAEHAQQIIYDSSRWPDPAAGLARTAAWDQQTPKHGHRLASDLNWRRWKYWRRLLAQTLLGCGAPESITQILVEHGPGAVVQAWQLVAWLATRLSWQFAGQATRPNKETAWQFHGKGGNVGAILRCLPDAPPTLISIHIDSRVAGKPAAFTAQLDKDRRVALTLDGCPEASRRTVTIQAHSLADLVARQLSDRDHDPAFRAAIDLLQTITQPSDVAPPR